MYYASFKCEHCGTNLDEFKELDGEILCLSCFRAEKRKLRK